MFEQMSSRQSSVYLAVKRTSKLLGLLQRRGAVSLRLGLRVSFPFQRTTASTSSEVSKMS